MKSYRFFQRIEQGLEPVFCPFSISSSSVSAPDQIDVRLQDIQLFDVLTFADDISRFGLSGNAFVDTLSVDVQSQSRGGVGLRVRVDEQHLFAQYRNTCRKVDGRRGFFPRRLSDWPAIRFFPYLTLII